MKVRKTIILTVISILLLTLAACGNSGADIPISRLEFGMSEEQVKSVVKIAPDEEYSDDMFTSYKGSIDIADGLWVFSFYCDEIGLYEIFLVGDDMPQEECFASRDRLIKNLSGLYGVSESDWKIENDGYSNFLDYINEDGQLIQLYIRLYDGEQEGSASITMLLKSYDNIPVIPKN